MQTKKQYSGPLQNATLRKLQTKTAKQSRFTQLMQEKNLQKHYHHSLPKHNTYKIRKKPHREYVTRTKTSSGLLHRTNHTSTTVLHCAELSAINYHCRRLTNRDTSEKLGPLKQTMASPKSWTLRLRPGKPHTAAIWRHRSTGKNLKNRSKIPIWTAQIRVLKTTSRAS